MEEAKDDPPREVVGRSGRICEAQVYFYKRKIYFSSEIDQKGNFIEDTYTRFPADNCLGEWCKNEIQASNI